MKKIINFINRTKEQIRQSYAKLKSRYKKVEFLYTMSKGMCNGWFIVEGSGKSYSKYK